MSSGLISRWRAWRTASKLQRGRCEWCNRVLPDTGTQTSYDRTCSEDCANQLWEHRQI